jgi:hypothetical protein
MKMSKELKSLGFVKESYGYTLHLNNGRMDLYIDKIKGKLYEISIAANHEGVEFPRPVSLTELESLIGMLK